MDVSIIIVNFRTPDLLINCISSIYKYTQGVVFEIIIVDNDPENGGKNKVLQVHPNVKWVDMAYNAGFGRANNAGMAIASGEYFLLLNADTLIEDNVIHVCLEKMNLRNDIIACGAMQYYQDHTPIPYYKSFNEFRRTFFILPPSRFSEKLLLKFFPEPVYQDAEQHDWLVGAFIFLRKEGFIKTGGFSEDFFMYGEDVEWSGRLAKFGKLCYFQNCKFLHLENKNPFRRTNISWINRFSTQMQVSNLLWLRKQYGAGAYLFQILHYIFMIPVIYIWKMLLNVKSDGNPVSQLATQHIYTRKVGVLMKYFWPTLALKKMLYKIDASENIDILTLND